MEELLQHGVRTVILSRGIYERLQVCPQPREMLKRRGIQTYVLQTEEAVRLYHELCETGAVGGLFHSTC